MMVIYLPVKFEFDWTNRFPVRVQKQNCGRTDGQTDGHINLTGGLVTHNQPKNINDIWYKYYFKFLKIRGCNLH